MTPLRKRFIEDMEIRNRSQHTVRAYVNAVARFAAHFNCSPENLGLEDIRSYQVYLVREKQVSASTLNITVAALRFLYCTTLSKDWKVEGIPFAKTPKRLPRILSQQDVLRLFDAVSSVKHRTIMMTTYSAALRVSEVASLRVEDIDSQRMLIHINQGKGAKDRLVPLAEALLDILRDYCRSYRPTNWLFRGRYPDRPISTKRIWTVVREAGESIGKHVSPHDMRHYLPFRIISGRSRDLDGNPITPGQTKKGFLTCPT